MRAYHIRICPTPQPEISRSHPHASDRSFTPTSIWQHLPAHTPKHAARRKNRAHTGNTDYRYGRLSVDWVDFEYNMSFAQATRGPAVASFTPMRTKSGTVDLPEGIVRVFREASQRTPEEPRSPSAQNEPSEPPLASREILLEGADVDGVTLGVLAVPAWMTASDFLTFVAPAQEGMAHLRMIRDSQENRSIVLINFRTEEAAREFAEEYNGRAFNSLEPETCHVVRVASVRIDPSDTLAQSITRLGSQAPAHELPTCPVCLERMDSAVTGLVSVPCSHTFHCACLSKWGGGRCPVCRYSQTLQASHPTSSSTRTSVPIPFADPAGPALSRCIDCGSTGNLWICLICGNIGCGRYGRAHAHAHYVSTSHLYALELETQRTWDYAADTYVHRLIQNKADGKLVELPSASMASSISGTTQGGGPSAADGLTAEKIEAIGIEYSYLLSSQLDTQRTFYEDQMRALRVQLDEVRSAVARLEDVAATAASATETAKRAAEEAETARRERDRSERKAQRLADAARAFERELKDERAVSAGLLRNLESAKVKTLTAESERDHLSKKVAELEDQVRDVMFFLEARDKIEGGEGAVAEAAGGSLEIVTPQVEERNTPGKKKKKR
ncbi:zf-UBP-domain-containing protein [Peniophora sp. CONT]|nr:zf-UBP-domain-containing protein [Peniophora sp. CONT]